MSAAVNASPANHSLLPSSAHAGGVAAYACDAAAFLDCSGMLRRHPLACLLRGLCLAAAAVDACALEPDAVFARAAPAVWTVKADLGNNQMVVGSAVAVLPDLLVTACHVVDKAVAVQITQQSTQTRIARITRDPDPARDLCVLSTATPLKLSTVEIAPIADVRVGQRVFAIGSPHGLELTLTEGLVSALRPKAPGELPAIQTSASISAGSSGGGLFDSEGRLIGVTDNISPGGENLGFAYPAQWLTELPQRLDAERAQWRKLLQSVGVAFGADGEVSPSGHAELQNTAALPDLGSDPAAVRIAYRQFLLQARPRAFLITGDKQFGTVTRSAELTAQLQGCANRKVVCAAYAVDDAVVWGKQQAAR